MTTILAIEDEPSILENILETLEAGRFTTLGAENGLVGINLARQYLPDLIVSDIMMPELDGYDVLLNLRSDPVTASIPFIFLTARAERAAVRQGMEFGADDYLTKPFTPSELLVAVTSCLERHTVIVRQQKKRLEDMRGNLAYMLPHELRTPLTGILGYSQMLLANCESMEIDQIKEMVQRLNHAGQRLYHLVENFLLYAQIEIVQLDPERKEMMQRSFATHPKAIIESEAAAQAQHANRQADLRLDVTDVAAVQISEDSLRKIVNELMDNAFKFSKPGAAVDVSGTVVADHYLLSIRDHGQGMTQQQIADVGAYMQFERKLREQQGAGLGLSIIRGLVELQGGDLSVESTPDQQTTVSVTFPLRQDTAHSNAEH